MNLRILLLLLVVGCTPHAMQTETLRQSYQDVEECGALAAEAPAGRQTLAVRNECLQKRGYGKP